MKTFKQLLFTFALIIGISITAFAQRDGDKKPPPKKDPPTVPIVPKKDDRPKDDKKKPDAFLAYFKEEEGNR